MTDITNPEEPLTLLALQVSNYKRLRLVEIRPEATGITTIRGRNEQGKSSILDAAEVLFFGLRYAAADPIRHGEEKAVIRGDFGNIVVTRTFTDPKDASKSKVTVCNESGAEFPRPQEVLEKYIRQRMDPVAFLQMKPAEKVQVALKMVDLPIDLAAHEKKIAAAEQARLYAGREVVRLEGAVKTLLAQVAGAPEAEVDVTALAESLADGERINAAAVALATAAETAAGKATAAEQEKGYAADRVARLEKDLEAARQAAKAAEADAAEAANKAADATKIAAKAPRADLEPIRAKIADARNLNRLYVIRQQYMDECKRRDDAVAAHQETEQSVKDLRQQRLDALNSVKWPHDGLGYDPETQLLTLHGVTEAQASEAQRLAAAADIAMAQPGAIRILLIKNLGILDSQHLRALNDRVRARGFQVFGEKVDESQDGPGFMIEDGQVVK